MNTKVLIAMSGGVDSSVAAYLMKSQGFDCRGATMKLFDQETACNIIRSKTCCSLEDVEDARSVAHQLDIPFHVFNFVHDFKEQIIERFINAYRNGCTPNPCIDCNRYMKFEKFFTRAKELDFDYIATGHYAQIEFDTVCGRYLLKKAIDETKDQSYVLYAMTQQHLSGTKFPLGSLRKQDVRNIATSHGFVNARKRESQDICFVPDGDYAAFIERSTGQICPPGNFTDKNGKILGKHKGIIRYTIGQRKGLGIARAAPYYVCSQNVAENTVILGDECDLYTKTVHAENINLIAFEKISSPIRVKAKVRYRQKEDWATVEQTGNDHLRIEFDEPQKAVAKGQAVVFYDNDLVLGGGTIQ
ncbi:MAG: tRNA 2-thiouridine(34) synthase MnmA [Planctomycetaceae bacterium]|jgi:tRNA-specific 2-thiouridylase|nr:tRNA 2-thiouridine(34) synthase MnmA [Planctomycetaceae bacterium]